MMQSVGLGALVVCCLLMINTATSVKKIEEGSMRRHLIRQRRETVNDYNYNEQYQTYFESNASPEILIETKEGIDIDKTSPNIPKTPEEIKLRGEKSKGHGGRVEVYDKATDSWGNICSDFFNQEDADVVCKQLGFSRGAQQFFSKDRYGKGSTGFTLNHLQCWGTEKRIQDCHYNKQPCQGKPSSVLCQYDSGCAAGWYAFNGACYKVMESATTPKLAENECKSLGAKLIYILSATDNNFISTLLKTTFKDINGIWTGGYFVQRQLYTGEMEGRWQWIDTIHDTRNWNNTLWFPGLKNFPEGKAPKGDSTVKSCIALRRMFPNKGSTAAVDTKYFWWDSLSCNQKLPYICQKTQKAVSQGRTSSDCYTGNGETYRGLVSRTSEGSICASWTSPGSIVNPQSNPNKGLGDHNNCRNPDGDIKPWCWVDARRAIFGYCEIPNCDEITPNEKIEPPKPETKPGYGEGGCDESEFHCPSMIQYESCVEKSSVCNGYKDCIGNEDEDPTICAMNLCSDSEFYCAVDRHCISSRYKCDSVRDCSDASDEKDCPTESPELLNKFIKVEGNVQSNGSYVEYVQVGVSECLAKCLNSHRILGWTCAIVNYYHRTPARDYAICRLIKDTDLGDGPVHYPDGILFTMKQDCTDFFECPNKRCIELAKKCDRINDCPDGADEKDCPDVEPEPVKIQLVGSPNNWEGRVEVNYQGSWGIICDDNFDMNDANVVCKMAGFLRGASAIIQNGDQLFGYGNGAFLIDELQCDGTEGNVQDCRRNPWGVHDCAKHELVSVSCITERACTLDEFRCQTSGICISKSRVHNGENDCEDGSDEVIRPIKVTLINNRTANEGLVVVSRGIVKGTVCDDAFDDNDAKVLCTMLGISGPAKAVLDGSFGRGTGKILLDDLQCLGTETNVDQCPKFYWDVSNCAHSEDVGIRCGVVPPTTTQPPPPVTTTKAPKRPCGVRSVEQQKAGRVVNGYQAIYGAFPWQAGVRRRPKPSDPSITAVHCGATIISEYWLVSAAHCFPNYQKSSFVIRVGDLNNQRPDTYEQSFEVEQLIMHPKFNGMTFEYDLALIRVRPVNGVGMQFNDFVLPACLPEAGSVPSPSNLCQSSGWGSTLEMYPDQLMAADLPLIDPDECNTGYKGAVKPSMMQCAGFMAGGTDTCSGDSGGPLTCLMDEKMVLWGAVSWGNDCARPGNPGVYAKVIYFLQWIKEIIPTNEMH